MIKWNERIKKPIYPTAEQKIRWEALIWKLEKESGKRMSLNDVYIELLEAGYKVLNDNEGVKDE